MSCYPVVLFFRYDKYNDADNLVKDLNCSVIITNNPKDLEKLYSTDIHILVTYGPNDKEYYTDVYKYICNRMNKQWFHYKEIPKNFESSVNYCFIDNVINDRKLSRPIFSAFTTSFNSFDKIDRPYKSLKAQTEKDWEWVIVDDSTDENNWTYLKEKFANEPKIRLYKRASNSGNIGNVKNEAIGLCRGNYILELDHDDEITSDIIKDTIDGFTKYPDVDFIYMDFINISEEGKNLSYGDFMGKGFGAYYYQYYEPKNQWVNVNVTPQINNITASYLPSMPNHPRIWRREKLLEIGSYSEYLPICDDQEILLRTITKLKILKIPKLAYIQYFNNGGSNFSLIRNKEINRLGPNFITPQFKNKYPFDQNIKDANAWHDTKFDKELSMPIWLRDNNFKANYINKLYNPDYDKQIGIIGLESLYTNMSEIKILYENRRNDFILIDNKESIETIAEVLMKHNLSRFKFYILKNTPKENLINYFERIYKSTQETIIFQSSTNSSRITNIDGKLNNLHKTLKLHHGIFNDELPEQKMSLMYLKGDEKVLEIGGHIGRNSLIISHILGEKAKTNLVVLETEATVYLKLKENRDLNSMYFQIENSALSVKNLIQKDMSSNIYDTAVNTIVSDNVPEGYKKVNTISYPALEEKYNIRFDTLILDCEGAFYYILQDMPEILKNIKLIIMENDYRDMKHKNYIDDVLTKNNFYVDYVEPGGWDPCYTFFYQVWKK